MTPIDEELLRLYEASPVLVAAYDAADILRYANAAFRQAFVVHPNEVVSWAQLMRRNYQARRGSAINVPDIEGWIAATQARRGKVPYRAMETGLVTGRWLWMTETVTDNGWMLCIASDISEIHRSNRELRQDRDLLLRASQTDELTQLPNRKYLTDRLGDMLLRTDHRSVTGSFAMIDIDNFKAINDQFGHHAGDLVLKDFATRLQNRLRRTDCLGRIGGEEFGLVLCGTTAAEAKAIVEEMLWLVRSSRPIGPQAAYSFSAGVAEVGEGEDALELYARADKALYRAKLLGRSRVEADAEPSQQRVANL